MRNFLLPVFLLFNLTLFSQSQVQIDLMSPKPSITVNGDPCVIGNTIYSCVPKTCNTVVITEGDSITFCTLNEIYLMTDTNYYMRWDFTGSTNYPVPFYDSFPNSTPLCYQPTWGVAGNYTVDIYYNGWLSAYPTSDCWSAGPSHWIINVEVMTNTGITSSQKENLTCDVFPNPGTGIFNLKISRPEKIHEIYLTTVLGEKIPLAINGTTFDLSNFPSGIYFLNLKTENEILIKKIIRE